MLDLDVYYNSLFLDCCYLFCTVALINASTTTLSEGFSNFYCIQIRFLVKFSTISRMLCIFYSFILIIY